MNSSLLCDSLYSFKLTIGLPCAGGDCALGWLSGLNLLDRKDLGLFCEVFAAIGVESKPIKDVSTRSVIIEKPSHFITINEQIMA